MPATQQRRGKSQGEVPIYQITDLTAGMNLRPTPTTIKPNQSLYLQNTLIANTGELGIYPGFKTFMAANGTRRSQGGKRIYLKGGTVFTLLADNGNIYNVSDVGAQGAAVSTGWTATGAIDFPNDRIMAMVFDSFTVPKYTSDGVNFYQLGMTAPVVPVLTTINGGSLVSGDTYEVTYTYFNSTLNEESNESPVATATPAGANLTIQVSYTASTDGQVNQIKIYARDKTAGEATRRLVTTVTNATSTYNILTNNWGSATPSPTIGANSVSLPMKFGVVWKNRTWGADATLGNRLRFTQVFQHVWPDTFYVDIPFDRGEGITAFAVLGDILVVFGQTLFYLILGQTSLDFEVRPALGAQTGAVGFRATALLEAAVVHAGTAGVYLYNGATDTLLSYPIQPAWVAMLQAGVTTGTELQLLAIAHHKLQKELRVAMPFIQQTGNRGEFILDLNRTNAPVPQGEHQEQAWFTTDRAVGGYIQWDGNENNPNNSGRIFSWDVANIKLWEERTGQSADGSDLTMIYQGFMLPFSLQFGRIVETYLEYKPDTQTSFSPSLIVDGQTYGPQSLSIAAAAGQALYGTDKYGTGLYSGGATRLTLPITWPLGADGHTGQLRFTYIGQGSPKFYSYGHWVVEEPVPRGL